MKILIQNGHVLDPESKTEGIYDILVEEKKIVKVAEHITDAADKVIDAKGCFVMPGFIDLHVHLRDPGLEYKETLKTGGDAAARGGVTTICAMPNTKPVIDTEEKVRQVHEGKKRVQSACDTARRDYSWTGRRGARRYCRNGKSRMPRNQRRWKICDECIFIP